MISPDDGDDRRAEIQRDIDGPGGAVPPLESWPPAPLYQAPHKYGPVYRSAATLGGVTIVLSIVELSIRVLEYLPGVLAASRLTTAYASIPLAIASIGQGIAFLCWTYRIYANLRSLGASGLSTIPAWSVGFYFLPIYNLIRPYGVYQEVFKATRPHTDPAALEWKKNAGSPLILAWWLCSVFAPLAATAITMQVYGATRPFANPEGVRLAASASEIGYGLVSLFTIAVVHLLTARSDAKAREIGILAQQ